LGPLKFDFYESGKGDTIIITFPDGGLGVVDAHPSRKTDRPEILDIVRDKQIHFVCLTHPHADHGKDLVPILETHPNIASFWQTNSEIGAFVYRLGETKSWPSELRAITDSITEDWAKFMIQIYGSVCDRDITMCNLRAGEEPKEFSGVKVHVLSPEESVQQNFFKYWIKKASNIKQDSPDRNSLSAILALQYGKSVVLLGSDAIRENWKTAIPRYRKLVYRTVNNSDNKS